MAVMIGHMGNETFPASIIVPTFREAPNLSTLIERIGTAAAQAGRPIEIIIVDDDSRDGTDAIVESCRAIFPVRLVTRRGQRGLASAVLDGFRAAMFDRFVVIDADLQHPPEMIPRLLDRLDEPDCDFVVGTRYAGGGGIAGDWPWPRRWASRIATWLAKPLAPLSDPMSGFFAIRRDTFEKAERLDPVGYKIALELYVKCLCCAPAEIPIRFDLRAAGASKFGFREQLRYARHLLRLYRFRFPALSIMVPVAVAVVLVVLTMVLLGVVRLP